MGFASPTFPNHHPDSFLACLRADKGQNKTAEEAPTRAVLMGCGLRQLLTHFPDHLPAEVKGLTMKSSPSISKSLASTMEGRRGIERRKPIWGDSKEMKQSDVGEPSLPRGSQSPFVSPMVPQGAKVTTGLMVFGFLISPCVPRVSFPSLLSPLKASRGHTHPPALTRGM